MNKRSVHNLIILILLLGTLSTIIFPHQFQWIVNYFSQPDSISWKGIKIPVSNDFLIFSGEDGKKKRVTLVNGEDRIYVEFSTFPYELGVELGERLASTKKALIREERMILGDPCLIFKYWHDEKGDIAYNEFVFIKNKDLRIFYSGPKKDSSEFEDFISKLKPALTSN